MQDPKVSDGKLYREVCATCERDFGSCICPEGPRKTKKIPVDAVASKPQDPNDPYGLQHIQFGQQASLLKATDPRLPSLSKSMADRFSQKTAEEPLPEARHIAPADPNNRVIGKRYEVLEEIGKGTLGTVYLVRGLENDKFFALKLINRDWLSTDSVRLRFLEEAKAAGRLENQNLVSITDFATADTGEPYVIMDYLEGDTVADLIKRQRKVDERRTARLCWQMCEGLFHAHRLGVLHRNFWPGNIFIVTKNGISDVVRIVDTGLNILINPIASGGLHARGGVVQAAKATYMSPELRSGQAIDERSDIYSLGCVMYEMLAGVPPFSNKGSLDRTAQSQPRAFSKLMPPRNIDERLERICFRCLEYDPDFRYQSMQEVQIDIQRYLDGETVSARKIFDKKRFSKLPPHVKLAVVGASLGVIALIVGILVVLNWDTVNSGVTAVNSEVSGVINYEKNAEQARREALDILIRANEAIKNKDYNEALVISNKAIARDKSCPEAYAARAQAEMAQNKFNESIADWTFVANDKKMKYDGLIGRARALIDSQQYDKALVDLRQAAALKPNNPEIPELRAWVWMSKGQPSQALPFLDQVLAKQPDRLATLKMKIEALEAMSSYTEEKALCNLTLKLHPTYLEAKYHRAEAEAGLRLYQDAINDYDSLLKAGRTDIGPLKDKVDKNTKLLAEQKLAIERAKHNPDDDDDDD